MGAGVGDAGGCFSGQRRRCHSVFNQRPAAFLSIAIHFFAGSLLGVGRNRTKRVRHTIEFTLLAVRCFGRAGHDLPRHRRRIQYVAPAALCTAVEQSWVNQSPISITNHYHLHWIHISYRI